MGGGNVQGKIGARRRGIQNLLGATKDRRKTLTLYICRKLVKSGWEEMFKGVQILSKVAILPIRFHKFFFFHKS